MYIYFLTPQIISDTGFGLIFSVIKLVYRDEHNKMLYYEFDHKDYDGSLMSYSINNDIVKPTLIDNIKSYTFKSYQYLKNDRILDYSLFTSSVSYLLEEMLMYQKRKLVVCIIVSVRNNMKNSQTKGNFLKLAKFTVIPNDTIYDICYKLQTSVKNVQTQKHLKFNTTFHDICSGLYNADYMFNSWRNLTSIDTKSRGLLIRKPENKVLEKNIVNLKHKKKRSKIFLDYLNDRYVISKITNI